MIIDPSDELLTFFEKSLTGMDYGVYTEIPTDKVDNYIHLQTLYLTDEGTKNSIAYDCSLTIDIATRFRGQGSRKQVNSISSDIMGRIIGKNIITQNFTSVTDPWLDTLENETLDTGDFKVIGKLMILRFKVQQN